MRALALVLTALMALPAAAAVDPAPAPKLVIALAVDQFSADLFAQYRSHFTGGFARLATGAVFPSGYQSHASTETCPGHSTILTGARPARTGIIANVWFDSKIEGQNKSIYCVEDETSPAKEQVISPVHLRVPTLGDRLKAVTPATRVVGVSGKDRSAVAMAGHNADEIWWYSDRKFMSYPGAKMPASVVAANTAMTKRLDAGRKDFAVPKLCRARDVAVPVRSDLTVGTGRLGRTPKDPPLTFQSSPDADQAVLDLALQLIKDMKLGRGAATDVLALGLSATDYVGHRFGTQGAEMCIQLLAVDQMVGKFFAALDKAKIDYVVVMTADHGAQDIPERTGAHGRPGAHRVDGTLSVRQVGPAIADRLKIKGPVLYSEPYGVGDYWIEASLSAAQRADVLKEALEFYRAQNDVYAVYTRDEILATAMPTTPPDEWSLLERVRTSYDTERSGDFYVVLKPPVSSTEAASRPYTTGHGTPWDYDRRVPIVFWRKGMTGFEQPSAVEVVDILPTLAPMVGLKIPAGEIDGRCLFGC